MVIAYLTGKGYLPKGKLKVTNNDQIVSELDIHDTMITTLTEIMEEKGQLNQGRMGEKDSEEVKFITFLINYIFNNFDILYIMMNNDDRSIWTLVLIDSANGVEGITRLHKYAFLIANRIKGITKQGFYNDWRASNYGPFSGDLADDIKSLTDKHLIKNSPMSNKYGYKVGVLTVTEKGKKDISTFKERNSKYIGEIKKLVNAYQSKELIDLLHDVYYLYPQYAIASKIRDKVGKKIFESDSYLNPEYDNSNE